MLLLELHKFLLIRLLGEHLEDKFIDKRLLDDLLSSDISSANRTDLQKTESAIPAYLIPDEPLLDARVAEVVPTLDLHALHQVVEADAALEVV